MGERPQITMTLVEAISKFGINRLNDNIIIPSDGNDYMIQGFDRYEIEKHTVSYPIYLILDGSGDGDISFTGNVFVNVINRTSGIGDATNISYSVKGNSLRFGGQGSAYRRGSGDGHAIKLGSAPGEVWREGGIESKGFSMYVGEDAWKLNRAYVSGEGALKALHVHSDLPIDFLSMLLV